MNYLAPQTPGDLLSYQTVRLRDLVLEMVGCCEDRKLYETQKFGLPYSELKCLMLFEAVRYLTAKDIAHRLDVAKSRITKIINSLMEKGLVKQIDDPGDGRRKLINLTPAGQKKSEEIAVFERDIHRKILLEMGPEERKILLAYLELLRSTMEGVKEDLV